jgi:predicted membrane-bound spermidine synthase
MSLFTVLPYYCAGMILSLALTRAPYAVGRTYGIDLLGAATGCLAALALMNRLDAPTGIMVLALGAAGAAWLFTRAQGDGTAALPVPRWMLGGFMAVLAVLAVANTTAARPFIYPYWVKTYQITESMLAHDEWNAISRVTVLNEVKGKPPYLWGPSSKLPPSVTADYYLLTIDGDAATPITRYDGQSRDALSYLEYDVTTVAYALPGLDRAAIIGVGGGRDVLSAHYFGVGTIKALDINNVQISLLSKVEPFRSYAGIADIPGVTLIHSEARSWFSRQHEKFDIIQMSLIDTWAATGAGAYALSENGLYTVQAFRTLLEDLDDRGVLTVSRWYAPDAVNETERLLGLASAALFEDGAENPADHIFVATAGKIATLVLARAPFSPAQLAALRAQAKLRGFDILVAPGAPPANPGFADILAVKDRAGLDSLARGNMFDISPPTDRRPFFFNQLRLGEPWNVLKVMREKRDAAVVGHARATVNLYLILGFAVVMALLIIVLPLRRELAAGDRGFIAAGTAWFSLIGLGFMLFEIALLQRMSIFLGHPSYSLGILLFSLILSTGIGSLLSDRFALTGGRMIYAWALALALLGAATVPVTDALFHGFADADLLHRALVCVAVIMPLGLLLGYGFPTGMALARLIDERPSAWFWGINGVAGVTGSALAVALNIALGLDVTMVLGALCYALLVFPACVLRRRLQRA